MRIISGTLRGTVIRPPAGLPVRPTTDMAKESLFNILENRYNLDSCTVLDLFAGTGNISFECCSRGAMQVTVIDKDARCIQFIKQQKEKMELHNLQVQKSDVFSYLKNCTAVFDIVFADPPYSLPGIQQLPQLVAEKKLLKPGGLLVVEHARQLNMKSLPNFAEERTYGQSVFTFFKDISA